VCCLNGAPRARGAGSILALARIAMVLAWPVAAEWRPVDVLVVRDALRDYRLRRKIESLEIDELRHLAQEGIGSRPDLEANVVFARLRARFGRPPAA
jgi:hypothetical protein